MVAYHSTDHAVACRPTDSVVACRPTDPVVACHPNGAAGAAGNVSGILAGIVLAGIVLAGIARAGTGIRASSPVGADAPGQCRRG